VTVAFKLSDDFVLPSEMGFANGHVASGLRKMLQDDVVVHRSGVYRHRRRKFLSQIKLTGGSTRMLAGLNHKKASAAPVLTEALALGHAKGSLHPTAT